MLISYKGPDEILVTTSKREAAFVVEFFGPDTGREISNYDRVEYPGEVGIEINAHLTV